MALWQELDLNGFCKLHDPGFVDHAAAGRPADRSGFRVGIEDLYRAFPDFMATAEDLVVDEQHQSVAIRWTAKGTRHGAFMGFPGTGRSIEFRGIEIIRCAGGRVIER